MFFILDYSQEKFKNEQFFNKKFRKNFEKCEKIFFLDVAFFLVLKSSQLD